MQQSAFNFDHPSLSPDEAAVLSCLSEGRSAAVSSTEITRKTGLTVRRIQQVVRGLRLEQGYMVMASTKEPMGYYLAANQDEIVDNVRALMSRGIKDLMVAARFRKTSLDMIFVQAKIQEGEG